MRAPRWMWDYFCLPAVPACFVGKDLERFGIRVASPLEPVYPCCRSLVMGFSWSLFFAQRVNEALAARVLTSSRLVHDRGDPVVVERQAPLRRHYVYVDNLGVFREDLSLAENDMGLLTECFNDTGLLLHGEMATGTEVEALGVKLDFSNLQAQITQKRFWR
eukprot:12913340-Prorocentrum_lima.AAC.1